MKKDGTLFENLKENLNNQNVQGKLDIDYKIVQKLLGKALYGYYKAIYYQDVNYAKDFVDNAFLKFLNKSIEKDKKFFENSSISINIESAELKDQTIETIHYIKDLTLNVNVIIQYTRLNKITDDKVLVATTYSEEILFKNYEEGWKISKILIQNNLTQNIKEL